VVLTAKMAVLLLQRAARGGPPKGPHGPAGEPRPRVFRPEAVQSLSCTPGVWRYKQPCPAAGWASAPLGRGGLVHEVVAALRAGRNPVAVAQVRGGSGVQPAGGVSRLVVLQALCQPAFVDRQRWADAPKPAARPAPEALAAPQFVPPLSAARQDAPQQRPPQLAPPQDCKAAQPHRWHLYRLCVTGADICGREVRLASLAGGAARNVGFGLIHRWHDTFHIQSKQAGASGLRCARAAGAPTGGLFPAACYGQVFRQWGHWRHLASPGRPCAACARAAGATTGGLFPAACYGQVFRQWGHWWHLASPGRPCAASSVMARLPPACRAGDG